MDKLDREIFTQKQKNEKGLEALKLLEAKKAEKEKRTIARAKKKERSDQLRRCFLVGKVFDPLSMENGELKNELLRRLNFELKKNNDRALFGLTSLS